jgi:hypothetical protein
LRHPRNSAEVQTKNCAADADKKRGILLWVMFDKKNKKESERAQVFPKKKIPRGVVFTGYLGFVGWLFKGLVSA